MKNKINEMTLSFASHTVNEAFARSAVTAFCVQLNPSLEEIGDIKTAVSEAVTNAIVHAYDRTVGIIKIKVILFNTAIQIEVSDTGCGIEDIEKAREPFFSTKAAEERSGMGFTVMESFMTNVQVQSTCGKGTTVILFKQLSKNAKQKGEAAGA